jgi:signal transduction histidine kinase/ligand-binding sensor domain-containing protein
VGLVRAHGRRRFAVATSAVLAGFLLVARPCAFALNPALDVSQYAHTPWKIRDGFSKGPIYAITQTSDGYLWLGTEFGLLRFDGVSNVPWQPPPDQPLPSSNILSLLAARDGTLWIGTQKGLASWKGGRFTQYAELAEQRIFALLEDRQGTIWVGGYGIPTGKLCAIQNASVQCYGEDGGLGHGVFGLYEDSKANLWAGVLNGLWRWKPDPPKFYPLTGAPNGISGLAEGDDGSLLIALHGRVARFVEGKTDTAYSFPGSLRQVESIRLLRDRDGGLWIGTSRRGLIHVHHGRTDVFARADGLSGDFVTTFFEDREANIWVSTLNGLDRFRDFAVATFNVNQGLSDDLVASVLADKDGSVWLGTLGSLNRWHNGQITTYDKRDGKLNGLPPNCLFQDNRGRIWISTNREFGYLENNRFVPTKGVPGGLVHGIAEDTTGNLWVANQEFGLLRVVRGTMVQQIPWATLGRKDLATALAADPLHGGVWLGFYRGGVAYFADGQVRASYAVPDGLGKGLVAGLRLDSDGVLWVASEGGLSRLKNGRVATLTSKNGLPCDAVHWAMEDDAHSLWLYMSCGLVRVARSELDTWAAAVDKNRDPKRVLHSTVFDSSDGVAIQAGPGGFTPQVTKTHDGKLWFTPADGASVIDPDHLPFNKLPPPVHIEQIIADRKTYDATANANGNLRLPPLVRDLEIDYTALSFAVPEKVRFRYKLEGRDRDWQDVGNRRQAFYSDLAPRNYRFRVAACNNSGVWNEAGAFLDFAVAAAYYQTTWFRLLCVAAILALLGAFYRLRLRHMKRQFNMRLEERVNERTRIARDLHDTMLQSFQGVLMKFYAVTYMIQDRPEAQKKLETIVEQARQAINEGRNAVQGLRSSTVVANDLARAISGFGEELSANQTDGNCPEFRLLVEGESRDLPPIVRDEVHRIACEALRNAFWHAQAKRIEAEIRYEARQFRLLVRDNGKGIEQKVLDVGSRAGHHGLPGMQERARLAGGKLTVFSRLDNGTEIELSIPASLAYVKAPVARR